MRLELHCHTRYSHDSVLSLADLEHAAEQKHLDAVAITDHGTISGALEAKRRWKRIRVIIGEEIVTQEGEIIGYFLHETIPYDLTVSETLRRIRNQGGLVSVDHPFCRLRTHPLSRQALERHAHEIDFLEIFNSRNVFSADDAKAALFAKQWDITPIVGSDAHTKREVGQSTVEISTFEDAQTFLRQMKNAVFKTRRSFFDVHVETKFVKWYKRHQS